MADNKQKKGISFLSFVLFALICVLTASVLLSSIIFNSHRVEKAFMSDSYVDAKYEDIRLFAGDLCLANGLSGDIVDDAFDIAALKSIQQSYLNEKLMEKQDSDSNYTEKIDLVSASLRQGAKEIVSDASEKELNAFEKDFSDYFYSRIEFEYIDTLKNICDRVSTISIISAIVSAVLLAGVLILIVRVSKKHWLGPVCDAFWASGIVVVAYGVILAIIKSTKTFYVFPYYLSVMATKYAASCIVAVVVSGIVLLVLASLLTIMRIRRERRCKG